VVIGPKDGCLGNAAGFRIAEMSGRSMLYVEPTEHPLLHQLQNGVAAVVFGWRSIEMHNARWERIPCADCSGGAGDTRRAVPQYISVHKCAAMKPGRHAQRTGRVINRAWKSSD
jgi:hypothetical protein